MIADKLIIIFIPGINIRFDMRESRDIFLNCNIAIGIVNIKAHKVTESVEIT